MHRPPPPPFLLGEEGGGGVEPPMKFSKGGGLGRISIFRGGLLGKRGDFFQGGMGGGGVCVQFLHKK